MGGSLAAALASLDVGTLFFIAICVTVLLGLFLLHAWLQEGNRALAWWSLAYLIGGASGVLWRLATRSLLWSPRERRRCCCSSPSA